MKQKKPTSGTDAIDLLESQHRAIEKLFAKYETADRDDRKTAIFEQIADNLAAHTTIEEEIFYPAAYARTTRELLREAVEEHLVAKRVIADLLTMRPSDENYDAKVKVLDELIAHHVKEEEEELFPQVKKDLPRDERVSLAAQMKARFESLMRSNPRLAVPSETAEAAPLG